MFRRPARRAFGSVALVCAAAGKLCIAFSGRKFFTGGRVGLAVFQPGMSAVAFIEGHKGGFAVFYVVLKKVFAVCTGGVLHSITSSILFNMIYNITYSISFSGFQE